jgi:hypothetical protein
MSQVLAQLTRPKQSWPARSKAGERQINRAATWVIRDFTLNGHVQAIHGESFVYFGFDKQCRYVAEGPTSNGKLLADRTRHTFQIDGLAFTPGLSSIHGTSHGRQPDDPRRIVARCSHGYRALPLGQTVPFRSPPQSAGNKV